MKYLIVFILLFSLTMFAGEMKSLKIGEEVPTATGIRSKETDPQNLLDAGKTGYNFIERFRKKMAMPLSLHPQG